MALYLNRIPIITRSLDQGWLRGVGEESFGCVPRDYDVDPPQMGDSPDGIDTTIDVVAYHQELMAQKATTIHRFLQGDIDNGKPMFTNLDQNGQGFCWAYSTAQAIMLDRMRRNLPPVRMSAHAVACKIKHFQDQGGWCGESARFARGTDPNFPGLGGYPTTDVWPEQSMNRKYDTPATWENAALHMSSEDWYDLGKREYDQELTKKQIQVLGVTGCPQMWDYNRFSHSMAGIDVGLLDGVLHPIVLNSWKGYGYHGLALLYGMWPDNACAIRSTTPSTN